MARPSDLRIPVFYPNDYTPDGAGMNQRDYDDGQIGTDNLRTIGELLLLTTFNRLQVEFQRRYLALVCVLWVEYGLRLGVGTGWRSYATQLKNWLGNPKQFANPKYSLHVERGPDDVAYAIDTVPYDALNAAHANAARCGINYLDHISYERHHCQSIELPNGGSGFTTAYAIAARKVWDLPYLGTATLQSWLTANAVLTARPQPVPPKPVPPTTTAPDTSSWATPEGTPSIRLGSTDANTVIIGIANEGRVSWLEAIMGRWPTSGVWDALDMALLKDLQRLGGITVDGIYGEQSEQLFRSWRGR